MNVDASVCSVRISGHCHVVQGGTSPPIQHDPLRRPECGTAYRVVRLRMKIYSICCASCFSLHSYIMLHGGASLRRTLNGHVLDQSQLIPYIVRGTHNKPSCARQGISRRVIDQGKRRFPVTFHDLSSRTHSTQVHHLISAVTLLCILRS